MMVKFNFNDNRPLYIHPAAVTAVHEYKTEDGPHTIIYVGDGSNNSTFNVKETLNEVLAILGEKP